MEKKLNDFYTFVEKLIQTKANETLEINIGRKYLKLIANRGRNRRVWCFINKSTGDIYKPATFNAPAKHARGNIYKPETYIDYQWTGPHYLINQV